MVIFESRHFSFLIGDELSEDEISSIVHHIMEETDTLHSKFLSFTEFEHMLAGAPDFINLFRIQSI